MRKNSARREMEKLNMIRKKLYYACFDVVKMRIKWRFIIYQIEIFVNPVPGRDF